MALVGIMLVSTIVFAASPGKTLPFTEEEDSDGARTVWFFFNVARIGGLKHAYTPAKDIPKSKRWLELQPGTPLQISDMAWWPDAVALLQDKEKSIYIFKGQQMPLGELEKKFGKPSFRRFNKAEKPLALVVFGKNKKMPKRIPAVLPDSPLYGTLFDLAINTLGPSCNHNPKNVWVSIADTDEERVYEIDSSGCITGEKRRVDKDFRKFITKMENEGVFR
jgi:hypothetical protein